MDMLTLILLGAFGIGGIITGYRWGQSDSEIAEDNLPKRGANGRFQKRSV